MGRSCGGKEEESEDPVQTFKRTVLGLRCVSLQQGSHSLGQGAKESPDGSGIFHKLPSFFFPTENFLAIFFSLILLLRCNFFSFYSDHPIRTLLSPEFFVPF